MKTGFYRLRMRPGMASCVSLPINARSAGQCCKGPEYSDKPPPHDFVQLLWSVAGEGEILINGRFHPFPADHVACYHGNEERHWRSKSDPWNVRWMTLDGPLAATAFGLFAISQTPHPAGPCPEGLFNRLEQEIGGFTPAAARRTSCLAYEILSHASGNPARKTPGLSEKCIELIRRHLSDQRLNVDWLAGALKRNRSVLSRIFSQETGVAPVEYINSMRLQRAVSLLQSGDLPISKIAGQCGYADTGYFCRRFRKQMQITPGTFRRKQQD